MASPAKLIVDETTAVMADLGTVIEVHLMGRARERKPIDMLGRTWIVTKVRERDGKRLFVLRAKPAGGPLMCGDCGSFELDVAKANDLHCNDCGSVNLVP